MPSPLQGRTTDRRRLWLRALAGVTIGLFLLLSAGLLLTQREAALERARAQTQREVSRLASELQSSLRVARASMDVASATPDLADAPPLGDHTPLIQSLNLPFVLRHSEAQGHETAAAQWLPKTSVQEAGQWFIPLTWHQTASQGNKTFTLLLERQALLDRFASDGLPARGSMTLFSIEDDASTVVLARFPVIEREQGLKVHGHVADALQHSSHGVMQATSVIDSVPRVIGYHRLDDGAERLALTYALPVDDVLAGWLATLPAAIAMTLLVAAGMAYGAWRLDRAIGLLHRSEQQFQTLAEHIPDVVVRCARDGRVLYANPTTLAAFGKTPEQMTGNPFPDVGMATSLSAQWLQRLQRAMEQGEAEPLQFSHAGPNGDRQWEARFTRAPATVGDPPSVLVLNRDVTAKVEAEARQRSTQRLFESVFQAAPEAMSLGDWETGQLLLVNDGFCELFGRSREQLIGHSATGLGLWRSAGTREQLLKALTHGVRVRNREGKSTRPDGSEIHVRYSAERVEVDGRACLLLMFRDVTELEQDQRALERSELRFRLAAAHGQVWEWDFGKGFVQPSDEFFVSLGHPAPPQGQMGQLFMDLVHPEDLPRLRLALRRYFKNEAPYRLEFRARDAQGHYHWFDTRASGLRDANGVVTYMSGTTFEISDRKALEDAQRQILKHLETVANSSPALLWTTNENKETEWVNQAWLDFTLRDLQTECAVGWLGDIHPLDHDRSQAVFDAAFEARQPYSIEYRLKRHDGEYRWLLEQGRPRYDADNRFIGYVGSNLDITELRAAEHAASERGAILEQVFDVIKDMLFVIDTDEHFVFYKTSHEAGLHRKPEEILGKALGDVMPDDVTDMLRGAMALAHRNGAQEVDYHLELPDGQHHFNARLAWLPGAEQCMFLVRDTTDQQEAQDARARLNDFVLLLFRLASRFINLPVQDTQAAINDALGDMGRFFEADRAYLFDYDFNAQTTINTHEWCAPGVQSELGQVQSRPFPTLPAWADQHRMDKEILIPDANDLPAGPLRDVLHSQDILSLVALPLMNGERCLGFVGLDSVRKTRDYDEEETSLLRLFANMLVNVRMRTEAEEQIRDLTEGLEQKVAERTAQLQESVQQLTVVNSELESFTYSASHDLRTPLRGIEGFSSLLLEEHAQQLDEEGRAYLQRIQKATMHMSNLVTDLLAYSRMQQMSERTESVNIATTVESVLQPFRDELAARQGTLELDIPSELNVQAEPQGLSIALRNLIDNALKFIPEERAPVVRIEATRRGDEISLQISDNGIGFDMKHHDRIFGMFQRLHRQDQIPGTGIGLAMVRKAVERMGGQIHAESQPGKGTTFYLDLTAAS
ncbi:hypothetical protein NBRC116584_28330 [Hydrogenophaga sp. 5NK40-0174]